MVYPLLRHGAHEVLQRDHKPSVAAAATAAAAIAAMPTAMVSLFMVLSFPLFHNCAIVALLHSLRVDVSPT